jgi:hypothetical protein
MPDSQGELLLAPTAANGVEVTGANAAALDLDVDVVVAKRLRLELFLVEFQPGVRPVDLEPGELLRVRHGDSTSDVASINGDGVFEFNQQQRDESKKSMTNSLRVKQQLAPRFKRSRSRFQRGGAPHVPHSRLGHRDIIQESFNGLIG